MKYASYPCDWEPCEASTSFYIDDILIDVANHKYENLNPTFDPQNGLFIDQPIIKFKQLGVTESTTIEFDLNNKIEYYALVIDELVINDGSNKEEILFTWFKKNLRDLYRNVLEGSRGLDAARSSGYGAHGRPGGKGGKGKTRHSPSIFVFIKNIIFSNVKIEEVSFEFNLKGLRGGTGGVGGNGSDGLIGRRGKHGRQGGLFKACKKGKDGQSGGQPGRGGRGGDGGCGGNGPELLILFEENESLWNVLERSKYDVSGADPLIGRGDERQPAGGGPPGVAGNHGIGGDGGRRAGNCGGGNRGPSGKPQSGSAEWKDWNLREGLPGTAGVDGHYDFDIIEDIYKIVFNDPSVTQIEE